jgi:hypothetical protein
MDEELMGQMEMVLARQLIDCGPTSLSPVPHRDVQIGHNMMEEPTSAPRSRDV